VSLCHPFLASALILRTMLLTLLVEVPALAVAMVIMVESACGF